jgi:hypothetical protein
MKLSIKIKPFELPKGHNFQPWLRRISLYDDRQLDKTNDYIMGFYNCTKCDVYQPYTYHLPPIDSDGVSKEAHNDWVDFQHKHHHGDGRVVLFEKKI